MLFLVLAGIIGAAAPPQVEPTQPPVEIAQPSNGGGGGGDSGTGYVWKEHGWVKATKVAINGVSNHYPVSAASRVSVVATPSTWSLKTTKGSVRAGVLAQAGLIAQRVSRPPGTPSAYNRISSNTVMFSVSSYNGTCRTLGIDEILIMMEMVA